MNIAGVKIIIIILICVVVALLSSELHKIYRDRQCLLPRVTCLVLVPMPGIVDHSREKNTKSVLANRVKLAVCCVSLSCTHKLW